MHQECKISIITVNYNGLKDTCELLDRLPLENSSLEVIVVDNASKNDEAAILRERYPLARIIRSDSNLGFAGGNNKGIVEATGQYLFFLNNDTVIDDVEGCLNALVARLESNPRIGMVCPKIRFTWGERPIQFAGYTPLSPITMRNRSIGFGEQDQGQYDTPHVTPYAHGAAMMLRREALDTIGPMPVCYFLYYEELDWSVMLTRAGYEIWYEPAATVFHKESQTTGQDSPLRTYYITRNRLTFVSRNGQAVKKYLSFLYLIFGVGIRDIFKHLCHHRRDLASATFRGIRDFIKH